jgi:DNA polymerase-3 subunit beta
MKFSVQREHLENELQFLQGIAEKKKTIPILSNILISAKTDHLVLSATDLEVSLTTRCPAASETEGGITVSSKKFFEVVRSLPSDEIHMSSETGEWLEVRSGDAFFRLVGLPVGDFPEVPTHDFEGAVALPHQLFREMINRTLFAVTKEDVRYSLNGALLEIGEGTIRMVATDAHRLALVAREDAELGTKADVRAIIPKKALAELRDLGEPEEMIFAKDEHHLYFRLGHRVLATRVIEGQFPAYEKVIPQGNPEHVTFDAGEMAGAIRRVSLLASERSRAVRFGFASGAVTITSSNPEMGEAREVVAVEYEGPDLTVSFNAQYVLDFLGVVTSPKVQFQLKDDSSQGMMVPVEEEGDLDYRYVVMPMRL